MATIFRQTLRNYRGAIVGWGLGIAALGLLLIPFYDFFAEQQEQFSAMMDAYPQEFLAFFGGSFNFAEPASYLSAYLAFIPAVVGIFTVMAGAALIAGDEESGRLDLILAHPISRTNLFWGRMLAFAVATALVMVISWLGFAALLPWSTMPVSFGQMALPFISLFALILLFGTLATCLSQLLASKRLAAVIAGLIMVGGYFLTSLKNINADLEPIAALTPYDYYQSGNAISGLNWGWMGGLLFFAILFALAGWQRFLRRDIRVGGEGGVELPLFSRKRNRR